MKRLTAVLMMFAMLCGCANFQFNDIPSQVEKPEGEYDKAPAVADYDDLMPVEEGVYTFDDGATVDKWAIDPQYYGEEGEPSAELYALSTGELLLKVLRTDYSGMSTAILEPDAWAAVKAYLDTNPAYDLGKLLRKAYARFGRAVEDNDDYEYRTLRMSHYVDGDTERYFDEDGRVDWIYVDDVIHVTTVVEEYFYHPRPVAPGVNPFMVSYVTDERVNLEEIAHLYREFDAKTGELIKEE